MEGTIWLCFLGVVVALWWTIPRLRYARQRILSRKWPQTTATIQSVTIGTVPGGKGGIPGAFVAYIYILDGTRCAGIFAMYGGFSQNDIRSDLNRMAQSLPGSQVGIRYKPSDINVSLLVDARDPRFEGLKVSQDPEYLNCMPQAHIADLIR